MEFKKALSILLIVVVLVAGAVGALVWRQSVPPVTASFTPLPHYLGRDVAVELQLEAARGGLRTVEVRLSQGGQSHVAFDHDFGDSAATTAQLTVILEAAELGLSEGDARLQVFAKDGFWRLKPADDEPVLDVPVFVDLTPPGLEVLAFTRYPAQGGAGVAVIQSRDGHRVDLEVGDQIFRSTPAGDPGSGKRLVFFSLAFDQPTDERPLVVATDEAGNTTVRSLEVVISPRKFKHSSVTLRADFLARKLPELLPDRGPLSPEEFGEAFQIVSRDMRAAAAITKLELAEQSEPRPLWSGAFSQPRNTRVFSNYADTRDYRYEGKALDTQVHLGFDLASVKQAPIPAANSGRVAFAGPLGIYGNTVVLDHGLGLMTLYAHLSSLEVELGLDVKQGHTLGRSGTTGGREPTDVGTGGGVRNIAQTGLGSGTVGPDARGKQRCQEPLFLEMGVIS